MGFHAGFRSTVAALALDALGNVSGFIPQCLDTNWSGRRSSINSLLSPHSNFKPNSARVPWNSRGTVHCSFDGSPSDGGSQESHTQSTDDLESHRVWGFDSEEVPSEGDGQWVRGNEEDLGDEAGRAPSAGYAGGIGMGSTEFVSLVKAQFDVLAAMLDVSQIVLFVRRENIETGALEFVPAMVYPERSRVLIMDADGIQVQEGPKELPWTENAADVLPNYPFISVRKRGDEWETPDAVENDDGGLSAPLMYASLVLGMITVWKKDRDLAMESFEGEGVGRDGGSVPAEQAPAKRLAVWSEKDKDILEKISSSVAMAAVLDQKQRWAAVVQVEQLRRVLAESLHQVKNPMTALRTFGKLLLRRLPRDDTLNRELAKDIILQSDRLVDLLLPVDNVIGLLAQAVDNAAEANAAEANAQGDANSIARPYPQIVGRCPPSALFNGSPAEGQQLEPLLVGENGEEPLRVIPPGVQDALLSRSPGDDTKQSSLQETPQELYSNSGSEALRLLFVQDVIEPVTRAAQAVAQARRVCFRWRVDDDLPGVLGDERALELSRAFAKHVQNVAATVQEALSNVVDNALKYCKMGPAREDGGGRATVVLRARPSSDIEDDWGAGSGVVIEVVDNGPGVDLDDLPHIFERGYRGKQPRESKIPGTGLGLGIAQEIMHSMGGDLQVSNKKEEEWGTGVKLFIPRHRN